MVDTPIIGKDILQYQQDLKEYFYKSIAIGKNSWSSYLSILDQHEVIKSYTKSR